MSEEFSFMNEKIKDKPFYKKKWVQIAAGTLVLAVVFGLVAGASFAKMNEWIEWKKEQEEMKEIEIPKDSGEEADKAEETETARPEESEPVVVEAELTVKEYGKLYEEFQTIASEASRALVSVTAVSNDVDWFNEAYENRGQSEGMIIGDNGVELLILTGYSDIRHCDGIHITFCDESFATAVLKNYDVTTDLAVLSVNLSDISAETQKAVSKAELGNSMLLEPGDPVLAIGRADGSEHSLKIGELTSTKNKQSVVDAEYTILMTDMIRNEGADGVLINLNGQIVGIMQERYLAANMESVVTAYGISDLKSLLERLSNNQDVAYLGIKGVPVTREAKDSGVPEGIYVTEVLMDSPAMKGGIQTGDIIQALNGQNVREMSQLSAVLTKLSDQQNISLEGRRLTKDGYKKINYQTFLSVLE